MITCPKCGDEMQPWPLWWRAWYYCPGCRLAGHLETLEWLRVVALKAEAWPFRREEKNDPLSVLQTAQSL